MSYKANNNIVFDADTRDTNFANVSIRDTNAFIIVGGLTSHFQGTVSGYSSGGYTPDSSPRAINIIEKFPFATDSNATDVGDLTQIREYASGQSSDVSGYTSGGSLFTTPPPTVTRYNTIDKFPFATNANATDVGNLAFTYNRTAGQSSTVSGYASGGQSSPTTVSNQINKFPFATDDNASDVADLSRRASDLAGQSSSVSGYTSGGFFTPPTTSYNTIDKFPFATDANATNVGDLTSTRMGVSGHSSSDSGYTSGSTPPLSGFQNTIDKFPFASDVNATDVGDLTERKGGHATQSSTDFGYSSGGDTLPLYLTTIEKFTFVGDNNATDVGDLTQIRTHATGQQY